MAFKSITRKTICKTADQAVTGHFRQNAGSSNRSVLAVTAHNRALITGPEAQRKHAELNAAASKNVKQQFDISTDKDNSNIGNGAASSLPGANATNKTHE